LPSRYTDVLRFSELVVKKALMVPRGRVTTYGRIARAAGGGAMAAQSVTAILGKAHDAGETRIPFHRIVYADGRVWVDERHRAERMELYRDEGIEVDAGTGKIKNFRQILFEY
jgi:alkylated DNA nucleotide flippase Atl1